MAAAVPIVSDLGRYGEHLEPAATRLTPRSTFGPALPNSRHNQAGCNLLYLESADVPACHPPSGTTAVSCRSTGRQPEDAIAIYRT
jgi:hypothetical protein